MISLPPLPPNILNVPFHSQIQEIKSTVWQKQGCGVTSLAMVIDFYKPGQVSVNTLLGQGIASGAYLNNVGWTYNGLIHLAKKYNLDGKSYDFAGSTNTVAFTKFKNSLKDGPVIVSVHYKFDPKSPLPHLVVIDGISNGIIYYNDPAAKTGLKQISTADFLKGWKKRFIVIRPVKENAVAMITNK